MSSAGREDTCAAIRFTRYRGCEEDQKVVWKQAGTGNGGRQGTFKAGQGSYSMLCGRSLFRVAGVAIWVPSIVVFSSLHPSSEGDT